MRLPDAQFWTGKHVLLTGHTGFKGAWLALWLERLGAQVTGVALVPNTHPNLYDLASIGTRTDSRICDIRDAAAFAAIARETAPDIVLHLAAQPLVRASYAQPLETLQTNVLGTANVLEAVRGVDAVRAVVVVTTDKVYHNRERPHPYREEDRLGGHDPYSASKAAAELIVSSYRAAFLNAQGVRTATARAGNVIGGGDWSEDRLIPDAIRAWNSRDGTVRIRNPEATRPWQHVLEPLAAYLVLAQALWQRDDLPTAFNFGPDVGGDADVRTVVELAREAYGSGRTAYDARRDGPHEAGFLALNVARARDMLGVVPKWALAESVARTMHWYKRLDEGASAFELCLADIQAYEQQP